MHIQADADDILDNATAIVYWPIVHQSGKDLPWRAYDISEGGKPMASNRLPVSDLPEEADDHLRKDEATSNGRALEELDPLLKRLIDALARTFARRDYKKKIADDGDAG